jgi:hypothetical protein
MSCIACSVIPAEGGWIIERQNVRLGPFGSEAMAVHVAITGAVQLREQDQPARVSVHDRSGNVYAEYCLCKDFKIAII